MTKLYFSILLLLTIQCYVFAQDNNNQDANKLGYDELIIKRANSQEIKLRIPYNKSFKKDGGWKTLLQKFQEDFAEVKKTIPDYKFFEVKYIQGQSLKVNEIEGIEFYSLNKGEGESIQRNNNCTLISKTTTIIIQTSELDDLLDDKIIDEIDNAISGVEYKILNRFLTNKFKFNTRTNSYAKSFKDRGAFVITPGVTLGFFRAEPVLEMRLGAGISLGKRLMTLNYAQMHSYDKILDKPNVAHLLGASLYLLPIGGIEAMWKIADANDIMLDYNARLSFKVKYKSMIMSIDSYFKPSSNKNHFGVSLGFGF